MISFHDFSTNNPIARKAQRSFRRKRASLQNIHPKSTTYPKFPKAETYKLKNVDWWDNMSASEAYAVDKASELRRPVQEEFFEQRYWKSVENINEENEAKLKV